MTRLISLVLGAGLAFASVGFAHADGGIAGAWKLAVGADNALLCTLTFAGDDSSRGGTVESGAGCPGGLNAVASWKVSSSGIQLFAGTGDLVAWLKPKGDAYVGTRTTDGRKLALSR